MDSDKLVAGQGQLAQAASAGRRCSSPLRREKAVPVFLYAAALAQPAHATENAGPRSVLMHGKELGGNNSAHGIADHVRLLYFQVVEQSDDVFDELQAIG